VGSLNNRRAHLPVEYARLPTTDCICGGQVRGADSSLADHGSLLLISLVKYLMGSFSESPSRHAGPQGLHLSAASQRPYACFNEGRTVYQTIESISKSNYPTAVSKLLPDDCSVDDSYQWILKAQRDFTNIPIRAGRNQFNCGKARTVCNALEHSTAEVIISIDSDCIFHPDAIRELTACFAEPRMGSVGAVSASAIPTTASSRHPDSRLLRCIRALQNP